jgi:hypothetical protein
MGETAAGSHFGCTTDVPVRWETKGANVCKSLQVWQAYSITPGRAIPELEYKSLSLFIINKMLIVLKMTVRVALAHRLLLKAVHKHGHYTTGVRQLGGFNYSAIFTERWLALGKQASGQPFPVARHVIPRRGILPEAQGPEPLPSVRVWTRENCVAGSSGKAL